jgi:hypothetical protein
MVNKKDFFEYMSYLYEEDYRDMDTYKALKSIMKVKDEDQLKELKGLITMTGKERLAYRMALACNGKELTPLQVDQYISMIEYALSNMEDA